MDEEVLRACSYLEVVGEPEKVHRVLFSNFYDLPCFTYLVKFVEISFFTFNKHEYIYFLLI